MSQFCFDTAAAAKAVAGEDPKVRVYRLEQPRPDGNIVKFVPGKSGEIALARFAAEVCDVRHSLDGRKPKDDKEVTKKQVDQLYKQAEEAANPEEALKILTEAKTLRQQLEEAKVAKKAAKAAGTATTTVAAPPGPPAPPSNVPAPPAL